MAAQGLRILLRRLTVYIFSLLCLICCLNCHPSAHQILQNTISFVLPEEFVGEKILIDFNVLHVQLVSERDASLLK